MVDSKTINVEGDSTTIKISGETTKNLKSGANDLKIFALSNSVLKPDFYSSSFLVTNNDEQLPSISQNEITFNENEEWVLWIIIPLILLGFIVIVLLKRKNI